VIATAPGRHLATSFRRRRAYGGVVTSVKSRQRALTPCVVLRCLVMSCVVRVRYAGLCVSCDVKLCCVDVCFVWPLRLQQLRKVVDTVLGIGHSFQPANITPRKNLKSCHSTPSASIASEAWVKLLYTGLEHHQHETELWGFLEGTTYGESTVY